MLRLAVNELTTFRWSLEADVKNYKSLGVDGIGVWRPKITDCGEEHAIDLIAESGLGVSSLQWAGGFTGSEGQSHHDSIEDGIDAVHLAAALETDCLVVYTGGRGGHTHKHARRLSLMALSEVLPHAELMDVNLAIEPMHRGCGTEWTFLHDLDSSLRFLDALDHPSLQLVLDTYHFGRSQDVLRRIPDLVDRIALVQLGDAHQEPCGEQNRVPLGHGNVPLKEIVACLLEHGYEGFFEVELIGQEIEGLDYRELLRESIRVVRGFFGVADHSQQTS